MELSDEAWKIVETESPSAWTAAKVRAAMPGTPIIPFPATVTSAWPLIVASAFTGYFGSVLARRDLGARPLRIQERADVEQDAAPVEGDEGARVQDLRPEVGHLGGLAVVELRDEARVGDARGIGGEDSRHVLPEHDAARRRGQRARSVAVRSVPPRPRVVDAAVGRRPRKPGTTGMTPRRSSGRRSRRARRRVTARSGVAAP